MKQALGAAVAFVESLCRAGTLVTFAILIGVVSLQVLGRVPGVPSPPWTEEVARFCLVWLVAFTCGVAVLKGELVNVDLFVTPLPPKGRWVADRIVDVIVIVFSLTILRGAWDYVVGSIGERGRSIDVPMVTIYAVTLVIPLSLAFFSFARLFGFGAKAPADHGETV
jgi:TRAP-type C4-dicarboxylate transport system permease small subunit